MARLAPLNPEDLTPGQRAVADAIISGPRGGLRGPFETWLRAPGLAGPAQKLGEYCRFRPRLPRELSELAILLTARHWKAQFEFWAHARLAREAGLPDDIIEAIRGGTQPAFRNEAQRAVHALVTEYFATNRAGQATYDHALAALGERGLVELVGIVGYYCLVSMTLNVFEVGLPPGEPDPLP